MPTAVAIQCVLATTPNVPWISGRVVNRLGLMKLTAAQNSISVSRKVLPLA